MSFSPVTVSEGGARSLQSCDVSGELMLLQGALCLEFQIAEKAFKVLLRIMSRLMQGVVVSHNLFITPVTWNFLRIWKVNSNSVEVY